MTNHLLCQALPLAVVSLGFANISSAATQEIHQVHQIDEAVIPIDKRLLLVVKYLEWSNISWSQLSLNLVPVGASHRGNLMVYRITNSK
jgi:hypothetical protein